MAKEKGVKREAVLAPNIDDEFKKFFGPLTEAEREILQAKIDREGMTQPLVVWGDPVDPKHPPNILIDGHNRLEICRKIKKKYEVHYLTFKDREAVEKWIARNQLGRRNITDELRTYLLGKYYLSEKKAVGNPNLNSDTVSELGTATEGETAERIAAEHKVSGRTVHRAAEYAEAVDKLPEEKQAEVLAGKGPSQKAVIAAAKAPWRDVWLKDAIHVADQTIWVRFQKNKINKAGELYDAIENKTLPKLPSDEGFISGTLQIQLKAQLDIFIARHGTPPDVPVNTPKPKKPEQGKPDVDWREWDKNYGALVRAVDHFFKLFPAEFNKPFGTHMAIHKVAAQLNHDFREAFTTLTSKDAPSMSGGPS